MVATCQVLDDFIKMYIDIKKVYKYMYQSLNYVFPNSSQYLIELFKFIIIRSRVLKYLINYCPFLFCICLYLDRFDNSTSVVVLKFHRPTVCISTVIRVIRVIRTCAMKHMVR